MTVDEFLKYATLLTGTEVKGVDQIDSDGLSLVLANDARRVDCSQLNELLLMVHKDRLATPFFEHFFGLDCTIGSIAQGVERFQKAALLLYGNFVFAYRALSRIGDRSEFHKAVREASRQPDTEARYFRDRQPKLLDIDRIDKHQTPFVGYLSVGAIVAEFHRCRLLLLALDETGDSASWSQYLRQVKTMATAEEVRPLEQIVDNFREKQAGCSIPDFRQFLESSFNRLTAMREDVAAVRARATKNQNTYLTWDHMDVYFATSMRKSWEYQDLYTFIERLMSDEKLRELNVRYFDPTQAYTENRVNKGLVEALMLKRARCTVYSVQDTDTLGKDSELASTLAQGKPVIAYIPDIQVGGRAQELLSEDPATILERLRFVLYADEQIASRLTDEQFALVDRIQDALITYCSKRVWLSMQDEQAIADFRRPYGADLLDLCTVIASSEKFIYDKRAKTLRESHPLALQVNLDSGVANGVLVVRTVSDCAALLKRVLLSDMEFMLHESNGMWFLSERISDCIYRVVTDDRKLNNCFWNFYLR